MSVEGTKLIENAHLRLGYLQDALRITELSLHGGKNLLAAVPQLTADTPYGEFRFVGGHRLWIAPEHMPRTYSPDTAVQAVRSPVGIILTQALSIETGISKSMQVKLHPGKPEVRITHTITNAGAQSI